MNLSERLKTYGMEQTLKYIHKDPEKNLEKTLDLSRKISPNAFNSQWIL